MEIKDLILLMWRNVRYLVLALVLGAGIGIVVSKIQPPVYEATTKVFVSRTRQQGNVDISTLNDDQLLAINLQLVKSQPVLNDVSSQLGSKINADNILVETIPNTPIIQINGSSAGGADGLTLGSGSDGSTIRGLIVSNFSAVGVMVVAASRSTVALPHIEFRA